jgi:hypothetical protein
MKVLPVDIIEKYGKFQKRPSQEQTTRVSSLQALEDERRQEEVVQAQVSLRIDFYA